MQEFDVIIVGGGPIGIACGLEAKKKGLSYVIIEKGPIVNSLFNYPINMQFFSSSEKLEIDEIPFISKYQFHVLISIDLEKKGKF